MSRGCGSTKLAQLAGKTLCYSGRELLWLSLGASTLLGIKQATVPQGWAGLLVRALSKAAALCACLSEQPRVPVWLSSTGTSCFLRLQLPSDTVKEKPPMSSPCPAYAGEGRGLSHHCPRLVPCFLVKAMRVVVLILFRVQTPVQHLLSTATAGNPPYSILTEADQHIRLSLYTLLPLYFYFFPVLVFSWRAGVGEHLAQQLLSCG